MANAESGVRRTIKTAVIVAAEVWISTLPLPWWVFPAALLAGVLYLVWTWVPPGKGAMGHIRLASLVVVAIWLVGIAIAAMVFRLAPNIRMVEGYPGEWPLSDGVRNGIVPLDEQAIRHTYQEGHTYHFTPFVENGINGVPLEDPEMDVCLPLDVTLATPRLWRPTGGDGYRCFTASGFGPVLDRPKGVDEVWFLTFPGPGPYQGLWFVGGVVEGRSIRVRGELRFELNEASTP